MAEDPNRPNQDSNDESSDESSEEETAVAEAPSLGQDQEVRGYYYDDSFGYEVYDPEKDDDDDET